MNVCNHWTRLLWQGCVSSGKYWTIACMWTIFSYLIWLHLIASDQVRKTLFWQRHQVKETQNYWTSCLAGVWQTSRISSTVCKKLIRKFLLHFWLNYHVSILVSSNKQSSAISISEQTWKRPSDVQRNSSLDLLLLLSCSSLVPTSPFFCFSLAPLLLFSSLISFRVQNPLLPTFLSFTTGKKDSLVWTNKVLNHILVWWKSC